MLIKPTVGRVLWAFGLPGLKHDSYQPFAAQIAYVWSDDLVNLTYYDHQGQQLTASSVRLIHDNTGVPDSHNTEVNGYTGYCVWMPYQVGQAKANS
jgi:hypothetical protein